MMENPLDQNKNDDSDTGVIFQDVSPGYKLFFLFIFSFVSGMMFDLLAQTVIQSIYGIDLIGTDLTTVAKADFNSHREALQIYTILHQIGYYLLPTLTFFQLAHKTGIKFIKYDKLISYKGLGLVSLLGVATLFAGMWVQALNLELVEMYKPMEKMVETANESYHSVQLIVLSGGFNALIINIFIIGMLVPLCEEFFFRGGLQQYMIMMAKRPWVGILITSLVFSILHFEFSGILVRFGMALVLGYTFYKSGSIWTSVILHATYNSAGVVIEYMDSKGNLTGYEDVLKIMPAVGMLTAGIVMYLLLRNKATLLSA